MNVSISLAGLNFIKGDSYLTTLLNRLQFCHKISVTAIELPLVSSFREIDGLLIKKYCDRYGINITSIHLPKDKCLSNVTDEEIDDLIKTCEILMCDLLVWHVYNDDVSNIQKVLKAFAKKASKIKITIENTPNLTSFFELIPDLMTQKNMGITLDLEHMYRMAYDIDDFEALYFLIDNVHIRDYDEFSRYIVIGKGSVDFDKILKELLQHTSATYTLECAYTFEEDVINSLKTIEGILTRNEKFIF